MGSSQVAERLVRVRERIAAACLRSGRPEGSVRLVAVSKRIHLPDVVEACRAGQWDLGENRVAEALDRQAELPDLLNEAGLDPAPLRWHFIGHLQRNKAAKAVGRFCLCHGVDSVRLMDRLEELAATRGLVQEILLEVNISGESQKNGLAATEVPELVCRFAEWPALKIVGLMGMGRYGAKESELAASFAGLRNLRDLASDQSGLELPELSMGMSGDFETAIAEGSTLVRIGGAIFGPRVN